MSIADSNLVNNYSFFSAQGSWGAPFPAPQTVVLRLEKYGNSVNVSITGTGEATASSTGPTVFGVVSPESYWPNVEAYIPIFVYDNGNSIGTLRIKTNGEFVVYSGILGNFTSGHTVSISPINCVYSIA